MYVFVSDLFVEDYLGGGELTTDAILKKTRLPLNTIRSSQITKGIVDSFKDRHWIFGNFAGLSTELLLYCCKNLKYSVIEYDYKYCSYRLPAKHIAAEGSCTCENSPRGKMVSIFYANASTLWFMSEAQRQVYYDAFPFLKKTEAKVLSSVFDEETLRYILSIDYENKNDTWLIQKSDSWVKGTDLAIKYAEDNNLKYELFSGLSYADMLNKFAQSKGFIFLPKSFDTCPRTVIEAKLLGCELILNESVQHKDEEWFTGSKQEALEYLASRAEIFWEEIYKKSEDRTPCETTGVKEETHFKIVIPTYNAEKWIVRALDSVYTQKYSNYECILSDDMSTDETWDKVSKLPLGDKFVTHKNTEKKYALKNIYDSIERLKPSQEDVIVVLDGDDWFSTDHVLSKLNEYYTKDKCKITYGSFVRYPDGVIGPEASEYPDRVVKNNSFREDQWRASHLKTFKYSLWNKVNVKDLKNSEGVFYEVSYDQAMMFPMLEMAGDKSKYIPEVMYVYNIENPNAVSKTKIEKQAKSMREIRSKKKYENLS